MVSLRCTVKGCAQALTSGERTAACPAGHTFDRAREGYWNLLQPQDTKSRRPGDSVAVVAARGRALARGWGDGLSHAIIEALAELALPTAAPILDVGCGDGFFLANLAASRLIDGHGVDLSVAAIRAAARRLPAATLVVANSDRALPFIDGSLLACLSIDARRNGPELARVLAPTGHAIVAVPAGDDLAELRELAQGAAEARDRRASVAAALEPSFERVHEVVVRHQLTLDRDGLDDLLLATYRARRRVLERLAGVATLDVTASHLFTVWRRHGRSPGC